MGVYCTLGVHCLSWRLFCIRDCLGVHCALRARCARAVPTLCENAPFACHSFNQSFILISPGLSLRDEIFFFLLRTALKDSP